MHIKYRYSFYIVFQQTVLTLNTRIWKHLILKIELELNNVHCTCTSYEYLSIIRKRFCEVEVTTAIYWDRLVTLANNL